MSNSIYLGEVKAWPTGGESLETTCIWWTQTYTTRTRGNSEYLGKMLEPSLERLEQLVTRGSES